jgi:hypothetical protein
MPVAVISVKLEPRRLRTVESFEAPDPWNGGAPATWNLDLHTMVARGTKAAGEGATWGKEVYALRSKLDGADRFLPESLAALWKTGRAPTGALPRLLSEVTPSLRSGDFAPLLHLRAHRFMAAFFALVALTFLVLTVAEVSGGGRRRTSRLSLAEWLARPASDGEDLVTDRPVPLAGTMKVAFTPIPPANLFVYPADDRFVLGWFKASDGHRLLLAAEDQTTDLPNLPLAGVTLTPESIGVPAAALAELRARVPGLDTGLVTAHSWTWTDIRSPHRRAGLYGGAVASMSAAGAAIIYLGIALPQARRRRQMAWLLTRL